MSDYDHDALVSRVYAAAHETSLRTEDDFRRAQHRCLRQRQPGGDLDKSTPTGTGRLAATLLPSPRQSDRPSLLPEAVVKKPGLRATCILAPLNSSPPALAVATDRPVRLHAGRDGLTRALAAVASMESHASDNGVAMSTLRLQLHAIFPKTGGDGHADLVRPSGSIAPLPEMLSPPAPPCLP